MQDLGVYPLSNSSLVEGNPYLICLILILFYTFFPFPFRNGRETPVHVREDMHRGFLPLPLSSEAGTTDWKNNRTKSGRDSNEIYTPFKRLKNG